jgi:hypothetical protein
MHPDVTAIVNDFMYGGALRDHADVRLREAKQLEWLSSKWTHPDPVLLVDTGSLNAWVTSVSRGGGMPSRLNFMSATVCADIASRMLAPDRAKWSDLSDPRVLIISPYKPHARLVSLLLKADGVEREAISGTVHSFQGSQADVVILDLVNDEPHWRVGHFMSGLDDTTKRLFNVAITRAKRRLIVVGDFAYCQKVGKKAFLGKALIPFLRSHYKTVDAIDVVPEGIANRAASSRRQVYGGSIKLEHDRTVIKQDQFYSLLAADLEAATSQVVMFSPFMTRSRMGEIETYLKAAIERDVRIFVVTKPLEERDRADRSGYRAIEKALNQWKVTVIHKRGMHEKLVFVDSDIVWTGSLNPLSFRNTQEVMERRRSSEVFQEYAKTLMLDELLGEYAAGVPRCPVCGDEAIVAEGTSKPFYWRCADKVCVFRRSVDDHSLKDGDVHCHKCDSEVELEENDGADGRARWVCTDNQRHKQLVKLMHLKLVKVRARISASRLDRLERRLSADAGVVPKTKRSSGEGTLFG